MQIGRYKLYAIEAGELTLDGGAMFGVVPKVLWEHKIPADAKNRILLNTRLLLISGAGRNILVDAGVGNKMGDKLAGIYGINTSKYSLEKSLKAINLSPDDITDVVLTHLHFDHAGGSTALRNGEVVPAFPGAKYYVQKDQLELAQNPSERDSASFFPDDFEPLEKYGQLEVLNGTKDICDGVKIEVSQGHTDAEQHLLVADGGKTLFYCGDMIPTYAHIPLPWIMAYDLRPVVTLEEKRFILEKSADNNWLLFFEHCPKYAAGYVKRSDKGFEFYGGIESEKF